MDKVLVVTFPDKKAAREGVTAMHELNGQGAIRLDRLAVITKDSAGVLSIVSEEDDFPPPSRTLAGSAVGSLIGLLGGLPGFAIGAGLGGLIGLLGDMRTRHFDKDFLNGVATAVVPGAYAVVAEVYEDSVKPVDARMQALGGAVLREPR